ncbi:MAG: dockerin type I domain-containing protein [Planctomycetota bacterium]
MTHPDDPQFPDDLIAELRRRDAQLPAEASRLDERIRHVVDEHYNPAAPVTLTPNRSAWKFRRRLIGAGLAAAAAVGLVVWLNPGNPTQPEKPTALVTPQPARPHDLNGDGRIDILDVFQLAQHVHNTPPSEATTDPTAGLDINRDHQVDVLDVETLGQTIVRLTPRVEDEV